MDILLGMSILLALLVFVFMVMCGYASTVDWIALSLHRHAEQVRRMHAVHDQRLRSWWRAAGRGKSRRTHKLKPARGPVPIQAERHKDRRGGHHRRGSGFTPTTVFASSTPCATPRKPAQHTHRRRP